MLNHTIMDVKCRVLNNGSFDKKVTLTQISSAANNLERIDINTTTAKWGGCCLVFSLIKGRKDLYKDSMHKQ